VAYPLPIAWGLAGVYAAEQSDKPAIAAAAAAAALIVAGFGVYQALRGRVQIAAES
jgi:uncharacterized caspase-like protein